MKKKKKEHPSAFRPKSKFLTKFLHSISSPLTHPTLLQFWYLLSVFHTGHACSYLRAFAFDVPQATAPSSKLRIADFLSRVTHSSNVDSLETSSLPTQIKMVSLPDSLSIL